AEAGRREVRPRRSFDSDTADLKKVSLPWQIHSTPQPNHSGKSWSDRRSWRNLAPRIPKRRRNGWPHGEKIVLRATRRCFEGGSNGTGWMRIAPGAWW